MPRICSPIFVLITPVAFLADSNVGLLAGVKAEKVLDVVCVKAHVRAGWRVGGKSTRAVRRRDIAAIIFTIDAHVE